MWHDFTNYPVRTVTSKYIGEIARAREVKVEEHVKVKGPLTAIGEHLVQTGHNINANNIKVLA